MIHNLKLKFPLVLGLAALAVTGAAWAADNELVTAAHQTIATFKKTDPGMEKLFSTSAGYAVFPEVKKGAFVVGGAGGDGVLFEKGVPVGKVSLSQVSVGAQVGGQAY